MKIELPDQLAAQIGHRGLLIDLATGMYVARHLTLGQAAKLANLSQGELQRELGRRQIPVPYDLDGLAHDVRAAAEIAST
jgi:Uncharacterized small protein